MDRRSFLTRFLPAAATAAVAPTYFFAPVGGWRKTYSFKDVIGTVDVTPHDNPYITLAEHEEMYGRPAWGILDGQLELEEAIRGELYIMLGRLERIPYTASGIHLVTDSVEGAVAKFQVGWPNVNTTPEWLDVRVDDVGKSLVRIQPPASAGVPQW